MKVVVSATSASLDAQVDPRFGRCPYFMIVDAETMNFEAVPNTAAGAMSGAGIQAAQTIANKGVQAVLTGSVGPNAFQALSAAGVSIITGVSGTVREAVKKFKSGQLQKVTAPTAPMGFGTGGGYGMGTGMGRGGGRGKGRGMGQGMGRGMGQGMGRGYRQAAMPFTPQTPVAPPPTPAMPPQISKEQEIQMLENNMKNLRNQLDQIMKRLEELKKK
jgi:predicted Fe-Mo cluster-binding NifX family protein